MITSEEEKENAERMLDDAMRRSQVMRRDFIAEQQSALKSLREKQEAVRKRVLEVQEKVKEGHTALRARTQGIAFRGTVNQRIDQGLIQLERLVQEIRDAVMIRDSTSMISLDPELHEEIEAESRNIMSSKFFKAIMKQLRKESDTEDKEKEE